MEENRHYVYGHYIGDELYFIGTGSGSRWNKKSDRNNEHIQLWGELRKEIIVENLSRLHALKHVEDYVIHNGLPALNMVTNHHPAKFCDPIYLSKYLYYDADCATGLRWKVSRGGSFKAGTIAGSKAKSGYYRVCLEGRQFLAHRVVYSITNNQSLEDSDQIDHLDRDKCNNRQENLRIVSASQNCNNRNVSSKSGTGVAGVSWCSTYNRWRINYMLDGKCKVKYINPKTVYPELPDDIAKNEAFNDAVETRKELERDLY